MKSSSFDLFLFTTFFLVVVLFSIGLTSALPSDFRCEDYGVGIGYKDQVLIKQGEDYTFTTHLYNSSTGVPLDNSSAICVLHLYNQNGSHEIIEDNMDFGLTSYDFFLNIKGSNFSSPGIYPYVLACFGTGYVESGVCSSHLEVTSTGLNSNNKVLLFLLGFSVILLVLGFIFKSPPVGFISGILLCMSGIYIMIYGFGNIADLYTQAFALVTLGFGLLMMIIGLMSFFDD
ncbi:MAG: hypothetical protein WC346_04525 [Methanogenium sp.]|jgi:hypothetical protein